MALRETPCGVTARLRSEDKGLIVNWLVKLTIFIALAGLVSVEGGSVLLARYQAVEAASAASAEAAFAVRNPDSEGPPEAAAQRIAEYKGARLASLSIDQAALTVTVKVEKTAQSFVIQRIGPLKKFRVAVASHTASYDRR
ncbi:MAG: hypothetical protein ACR2FO_06210 [Actinomycetota bacterium]